jgi:hypothetical protein
MCKMVPLTSNKYCEFSCSPTNILRYILVYLESIISDYYMFSGSSSPPPKCQSVVKAVPNSLFRGKYIYNNLIRIRVSLICKLSGTLD